MFVPYRLVGRPWAARLIPGVALAVLVLGGTGPARAQLVINPTFDNTITSDPNAATIEASINAVLGRMKAAITNPITVNITFQEVTSGLGQSSTFVNTESYTAYRNALQTHQTLSANDVTALASLPVQATNPVNGNANVQLTTPLIRALGFTNGNVASDSTIGLNTSIMNLSRTGSQNSNFYDLQAVVAHEVDEVFGVGGPSSVLPTTSGAVGNMDLFRYSAPATRSFTTSTSATAYFSIDGGVTNLVPFNQSGGGADYADWGSHANPPQVQDAFGTPGAIVNIGTNELTALDVVGYNLAPVPEPGSLALTGLAATTVVGGVWRRRRARAAA